MKRLASIFACLLAAVGCQRDADLGSVNSGISERVRTSISECTAAYALGNYDPIVEIRLGQRVIQFPCAAYTSFAYRLTDGPYTSIDFMSLYSGREFAFKRASDEVVEGSDYTAMPGDLYASGYGATHFWESFEAGEYFTEFKNEEKALTYGTRKGEAILVVRNNGAVGLVTCVGVIDFRDLMAIVEVDPNEAATKTHHISSCRLKMTLDTGPSLEFLLQPPIPFIRDLPASFHSVVRYLRALGL